MSLWRSGVSVARACIHPGCSTVMSLRGFSDKRDKNPSPKCSDKGSSCGKLRDCDDPRFTSKKGKDKGGFQFHHLVKLPRECCDDPCQDRYPPIDDCLYKSSDKAKRIYQVTWVECPPLKIKPKKICCFEKSRRPPIPRRKRKEIAKVCEKTKCLNLEGSCPKITLPGCRPVAASLVCVKTRQITPCKKVDAPYPSFSECKRDPPRPLRRIECNCLDIPSQCEILRVAKARDGSNRKGNCGGRG